GLAWARGWVVVAARAAGLPAPVQSVYTDVADLDGLRASTRQARAMGFVGRSVVHPRQIPVVHAVFTPSAAEVAAAEAVLAALRPGEAAVLDADGRFVDAAVVRRARLVLDLHDPSTGGTH
ncbi:HpcH/HpaI aldolase/citrate lyase family protein, partial [Asanoa sp. NPDC050611]|uniref:HpcH/HpaI aldolase/citrate lyase family protein n=1 Tax=Asanoa sp. NPDC050611 TaxID=3157098 RepID=UPI0033C23EF0